MLNEANNRYASLKDLNNYFKIKDLLVGLTDKQLEILRKNIKTVGILEEDHTLTYDNHPIYPVTKSSNVYVNDNTTLKEKLIQLTPILISKEDYEALTSKEEEVLYLIYENDD